MADNDLAPLVRKLQVHGPLPVEDREAILRLPFTRRLVSASSHLFREGEPSRCCTVLLSGFACRHKIVGNGGRQIVSLNIPGDALDFHGLYLHCSDHNAQTLTRAELALIPMADVEELIGSRPAVAKAVLQDMLVDASVLREWVTNIGRRDARTKIAHLLCEFACRLDAAGMGGPAYELPMTQEQIGDAVGLTSVHVNRSIRQLEADGLVMRNGRSLSFPSIEQLRHVGDFSALYLHLHADRLPRAA